MHLPEIDKYAHLKSPFHAWDPRIKIASLLCLIISIAFIRTPQAAFMAFLLAFSLVLVSRVPLGFVLGHLKWVVFLVLFFLATMTLTGTPGGLEVAGLIGVRAVSCVLLVFPMMGTTRLDLSLKAMERLRLPRQIVEMVQFSYRYAFVLLDELQGMRTAARSRGFRDGLRWRGLRTTASLAGMLLVRGFERTERVYQAMVARGYDGRMRTLEDFRCRPSDWLKGFLVVGAAIGLWLWP